jgi:hypothetical protein
VSWGSNRRYGYLTFTIVFGQKIAVKAFHVTMMCPEDYTSLQEKVNQTAKKMKVPAPKVGLIDDLRPNAFTLGYGKKTVIVFSLGILKMLNIDELTAVASHELAHVKARDYLFRSLSYTLNILSFFNPLSYLAASQAQKERELLADEKAASLLSQPHVMSDVLVKLEKVLQRFPKERLADRLSASLFLVSPLSRRSEILAAHPQISSRVHNITAFSSKTTPKPINRGTVVAWSLILILAASAVGYGMVSLQTSFLQKNNPIEIRIHGSAQVTSGLPMFVGGSGPDIASSAGTLPIPYPMGLPLTPPGGTVQIQGGGLIVQNFSQPDYLP